MNVSFYGRLTRDPEGKSLENGTEYSSFTVATKLQAKDGNDYKTLFINVNAFGSKGKTIAKYFRKSSRIVVHGLVHDVKAREYNGKIYLDYNVGLTDFEFIDTKAESNNNSGDRSDDDLPW